MALNYDMLISLPPFEGRQVYTMRDTMLYALGLGIGQLAVEDPAALRYVFEDGLHALPTMAIVLAYPGFWVAEPQYGLDWRKILHADQSLEVHAPLPAAGIVRSETQVEAIFDKGADKGALMYLRRTLFDDATGGHLATVRQGLFLRGDGGFGGRGDGAPVPAFIPERAADLVVDAPTRREQALIYRLSGDYNPLHVSPGVAAQAGFPRPILHGLATFGIAGYAALAQLCDGDMARLRRIDARFSSPVFPGETLRVELWRTGSGRASLQVRVVERDLVVLKNGYVEFGE